jgi:hypothetical protein
MKYALAGFAGIVIGAGGITLYVRHIFKDVRW